MSLEFTIGVVVEGVGNSTSDTGGLAFSYGDTPTGTTDYEWAGGLQSVPGSIEDKANLFTGSYSTSAYTFSVARSDLAAQSLLYTDPEPDYALASALTDSATSVTLEDLEAAAVTTLAGEVVYVRNEAILLGTHTGSGTYTGCTRGVWSTSAAAHPADTFVYRYNPFLPDRQVRLVFYDRASGTEEIRWRGYVESSETNENGTTIELRCVSLFSALQNAELNRDPRKIRLDKPFTYQAGDQVRLYGTGTYVPRLHKLNSSIGTIPVQAGDTFTLGTSTGADAFSIDEAALEYVGAPAFPFDEEDAFEIAGSQRVAFRDDIREVWYTDAGFNSGTGGPSTVDLTYPLHPIHIAMAFMTSTDSDTPSTSTTTFDAFGEQMAAGLPLDWFDVTAIAALVADDPDLQIDRLGPLAWDGKKVNLFDLTNDVLLRPYGYMWSQANNGLITIMRLEGITIDEFCTASTNALTPIVNERGERLKWSTAKDGQFNTVTADVGGLPWREPDRITINSRDNNRSDTQRTALFRSSAELRFDLRTFAPQADDSDILSRLLNFAVLGYYALPTIGVLVRDSSLTGVDYDIGKAVTINAPDITRPWFIDRDRNVVEISADNEAFVGKIVGRKHIFDQAASIYALDLLLPQWASNAVARWRAPALEVVSATGTTVTVTQNAFHSSANDTSFFATGQTISAFEPDGPAVASSSTSITAIGATTITTADDISGVLTAGDIIRVDDYDNYDTEAEYLDCALRVWVYMADADEGIGAANDQGDVYG